VVLITLLLVCVKIDVASERLRRANETREGNQQPGQKEQQEDAAHSTIREWTTSREALSSSVSSFFIIYFNIFELLDISPVKKFLPRKLVHRKTALDVLGWKFLGVMGLL